MSKDCSVQPYKCNLKCNYSDFKSDFVTFSKKMFLQKNNCDIQLLSVRCLFLDQLI